MKATELMIGDWVMCQDKPIQIQFIYNDGYDDNVAEVEELYSPNLNEIEPYLTKKEISIKDIEPIPLTPEILEKNGFINGEFYAESHIEDWQIMSDCSHLAARSERGWCIDIPCRYVHELQHALRLCGFEELADNFKV